MVKHDAYVFTMSDHPTFGCPNMKAIATHIVYIFNCIHGLIKNGQNFFGSLVYRPYSTKGKVTALFRKDETDFIYRYNPGREIFFTNFDKYVRGHLAIFCCSFFLVIVSWLA